MQKKQKKNKTILLKVMKKTLIEYKCLIWYNKISKSISICDFRLKKERNRWSSTQTYNFMKKVSRLKFELKKKKKIKIKCNIKRGW